MSERKIGRKDFILGMGSLATLRGFGIKQEGRRPRNSYEQILRGTSEVHSFIHNAENITGFEKLQNTTNIHAMELDILSLNGKAVIGHSESEVIRIPSHVDELREILSQVKNNGFQIHIDLKSPDIDVAEEIYDKLAPGAFISTPHHELLDHLSEKNEDKLLLYTINSREKRLEFKRRLLSGEEFKNSGISIHHKYLNKDDVDLYKKTGLYVLAYPANRFDVAANLCEMGVSGITSDESAILDLIAFR